MQRRAFKKRWSQFEAINRMKTNQYKFGTMIL